MRKLLPVLLLVVVAAGCGNGGGAPPATPTPIERKAPAPRTPEETIRRNELIERAAKVAAVAAAPAAAPVPAGSVERETAKDPASAPAAAAPAFAEAADGGLEVIAGGLVCKLGPLGPTIIPSERGVPVPELALRMTLERVRAGGEVVWARPDGAAALSLRAPEMAVYAHAAGFEESYEARREGIEQRLVFASDAGLRGGADVVIDTKLATPLKPDLEGRRDLRSPIAFGIGPREVLSYGAAVAIDADGRRLELATTVDDRRLRIVVDGAWIAAARFPVTVDPLIGTMISPSTSFVPEHHVDVAYSATSDRFLCVWEEEYSSTDHDIKGAVYAGDGSQVRAAFSIDAATADSLRPRAAWTRFEDKFLVVWQDSRNGTDHAIMGRLIDKNGSPLGNAITVYTSTTSFHRNPDVGGLADGGGGFIAVWELDFGNAGTDFDCAAAMVDAAGQPGGLFFISGPTTNQTTPSVNQVGGGTSPYFAAWVDDRNASATKKDIWGASVSASGGVGTEFVVAQDPNDETDPDVARNGAEFAVAYGYLFAGTDPDIRAQRVTSSGTSGSYAWIALTLSPETQPAISFYDRTGATPEYLVAWTTTQTGAPAIFVARRSTDLAGVVEANAQLASGAPDSAAAAAARTGSPSPEHWVAFERLYGATDSDPRIQRWGFVPSAAPVADFSGTPTSGPAPLTVQFTDLSTGAGITAWAWTFGDGTSSTQRNPPPKVYANPGSYTVTLTVTGAGGLQDIETKNAYITVQSPVAPPVSDGFEGRSVIREATASPQFPWRTGGHADWVHDAASGGAAGSASCARGGSIQNLETTRLEITWNMTTPTADVSFFRRVESESGYDFLNFLVDGVIQRQISGSQAWAQETVTVSGAGRHVFTWSYEKDLSITAPNEVVLIDNVTFPTGTAVQVPDAAFSAVLRTGAAPFVVTFTSTSLGATRHEWDFDGNGLTDLTRTAALNAPDSVTYTYTVAGTYTVALRAVNAASGENDTETRVGYVVVTQPAVQPPVAGFSGTPLSGSSPLTVQFTDGSLNNPTAWAWDLDGNGVVDSNLQNPTFTYVTATARTYSVSLTVTNAGGSDTTTKAGYVSVTPAGSAPQASFTASPTSGRSPLTVQFTDTSTGNPTSWAWDFDNNGTTDSTQQRPVFTYNAPIAATFTAKLTASNASGSSSATQDIRVSTATAVVVANFTAQPTAGPAPLAVQFTDQSTGPVTSWLWSFGDGATSTQRNPTHTYTANGTYNVFLTVSDGTNTSTLPKNGLVVVGPGGSSNPPIRNIGGSGGGSGGGCAFGGARGAADAGGALAPIVALLGLVLALRRRG